MTRHSNPFLAPDDRPLIARLHEMHSAAMQDNDGTLPEPQARHAAAGGAALSTLSSETAADANAGDGAAHDESPQSTQSTQTTQTTQATQAPHASLPASCPGRGSGNDGSLPFIGSILDHLPGRSIRLGRLLTLADDLFLADHHFVHAPGVKPLATCLPVVPMTFSMEMMAEAAACLAPGLGLSGFQDVSAGRWLALEDSETLMLHIEAHSEAHGDTGPQPGQRRIAVSIRAAGAGTDAISATLLFGRQYEHTVAPAFSASPPLCQLFAPSLYAQRELFHGPRLHCLHGAIEIEQHGARAELLVQAANQLFQSNRQPQLLTDPALLDGVGQLLALWASRHDYVAFPIGLEKLELYGPTPAAGSRLPIRLQVTANEIKTLHADIEIGDGADGVWLRIKDWKSWKFRWDRQLRDFRRQPDSHLLSDRLEYDPVRWRQAHATPHTPTEHIAQQDFTMQRITARRISGFDRTLLARHYLNASEMLRFSAMSAQGPHQLRWLLGRIAAKDAVRSWCAGGSAMPHPAAFGIDNDERGQPQVVDWPAQLGPRPSLSIAHCEQQAVAMAGRHAVGIDIEAIAERDPTFLDAISSQAERALLAPLFQNARAEWIARLWCAKEVLGKLMGTGINQAPSNFEACAIDIGSGCLQMRHRCHDVRVQVMTVRDADFVLAFSLADRTCD